MNRLAFFTTILLVCSGAAFAQSAPSDSQTLQALLAEVHLLRQDLQTTTIAAQRAQILLYRLQSQQAAAARSASRLTDARNALAEAQKTRKEMETTLKTFEDTGASMDPEQKKRIEEFLPRGKAELENLVAQEPALQQAVSEAEEQSRVDQAKLSDMESQLTDLDKTLENAARIAPKPKQ